ncbi:leucine-rich repeat domain-containing protein [Dysgonomonas macrotermitis]|uniref:Por secretion system C-terminal sorting domain-containing protein n=1 Tax=Dysgonomonas macrotermitis TaxID=1346286 RepID=A0A1M4W7V5_9BACT|nr:leucine-rich repeat protein [Dysgonomonas macrotermitis]SHE77354.1 Por secretion system C-terminal sorting domain-containing protein [Dysgonomonas macrotermitis]
MKNKLYLLLLSIMLSISVTQAQLSKSVNVTTPGSLATLLGNDMAYVTELTLTGTINASDFTSIKSMSALKALDMGNVIIDNGMIPNNAFQGKVMDKLILPSNVESIGTSAFANITIPTIDFSSCPNLKSMGTTVFSGSKIGNNIIDFSQNLSLLTFTSGTYGATGAFTGYGGHVILPVTMKVLPAHLFKNFTGTVDLPAGLEEIGSQSFMGANSSRELVIPSSVITIGDNAFSNITIPSIDFSSCSNLKSMSAPVFSGSKIGNNIVDLSNCSSLETFSVGTYGSSGTFTNYGGHVVLPTSMKILPGYVFMNFLGSVELPQGLEEIGQNSFYGAKLSSQELVIPITVKTIKDNAFANITVAKLDFSRCQNLTSLGVSVFSSSKIGNNIVDFRTNSSLSNFAVGFSNTSGAFSGYSGHVILPRDMKVLPNCMFMNFYGSVDLPPVLEEIGIKSFYGAKLSNGELVIPNTVLKILESGLSTAVLENLTLPTSLQSLGNNAFSGISIPKLDFSRCQNLTSLGVSVFSSSQIGNNIVDFSTNSSLSNFAVGFSNTSGAFSGYSGHVILPRDMKVLPDCMFMNFYGSVDLPPVLEKIGIKSFYGSKLSNGELIIPNTVQEILESGLSTATLNKLILPADLQTVGNSAFAGISVPSIDFSRCPNLQSMGVTVFSSSNIGNKTIDLGTNSNLSNFAVGFSNGSGVFSGYSGHVILPRDMKILPNCLFMNFYGTVNLPESLEEIGIKSFYGAKLSNQELIIPRTVKTIRDDALNIAELNILVSFNPIPSSLGNRVFTGIDKTKCVLFVPKGSVPLYAVADQWKDFLSIEEYTVFLKNNLELKKTENTNLYKIITTDNFNIELSANIVSKVRIGLYYVNGVFAEDITKSVSGNTFTCQISQNIQNGSYNIIPYFIEDGERKLVSRLTKTHLVDRLPVTVENNWNTVSLRNSAAEVNGNLLIDTGTTDLMEITAGSTFKVFANSTYPANVALGLFNPENGFLISLVSQSVSGRIYTCKIPSTIISGKYTLIPYQKENENIRFTERTLGKEYLVDRLPIYITENEEEQPGTDPGLTPDPDIDFPDEDYQDDNITIHDDNIEPSGDFVNSFIVEYFYDASGNRIMKEITLLPVLVSEGSNNAITDETFKNKVIIYPNPTKGKLDIEISDTEGTELVQARIFNINGQIIDKQSIKDRILSFDLSGNPSGVYILVLEIGQKRSTWKIIKE